MPTNRNIHSDNKRARTPQTAAGAVCERPSFFKSLRFKLVGSTILASILLNTLLVSFLFYDHARRVEREYIFRATATARVLACMLTGEMLDHYADTLEKDEQYETIRTQMNTMLTEHDLLFMYVVQVSETGQLFLFDADAIETFDLGDFYDWNYLLGGEHLQLTDYTTALYRGERVGPRVTASKWGEILSVYEPIYRTDGTVSGFAGVDLSFEEIINERNTNLLLFGSIGAVLFILTVSASLIITQQTVITPIQLLVKKSGKFLVDKFDGEMPKLYPEIHDGSEIAFLERSLIELERRVYDSIRSIQNANEHVRAIHDAMPIGCNLWVRDKGIIDCNIAAYELFGFGDKENYMDNIFASFPEYQPNGEDSKKSAIALIERAFMGERIEREWMHQSSDGAELPVELTFVKIDISGADTIAVYIRDLRDQKQMINEITRRDSLLLAVNHAANTLLLARHDKSFEDVLLDGLEIIARCAGANSVEIWENARLPDGRRIANIRYIKTIEGCDSSFACAVKSSFDYAETDNWYERFLAGEYIHGVVSELSETDRRFLEGSGIKTVLSLPLFDEGRLWGICCIDKYAEQTPYTEDEISILQSATLMIMGAIYRHEAMAEILRSAEKERELKNQSEAAYAASELKSQFLANMSHEIRTPMNAILGMTELLLEEELTYAQKSNVEDINVSAAALLDLINDILDISKIQAGKLPLNEVHYDFSAFIDNINAMVSLLAKRKGITYKYEAIGDLPKYLYGDDMRLRQILVNVLGNAVKFTSAGGVTFSVQAATDTLTFVIQDTGIGIRKEDAEVLFDAFVQVDIHKNQGKSGTGLGLSITKSLLEMMNGEISLVSEYGKGSEFTITLPFVHGDKVAFDEKKEIEIITAPFAKVLVIDDNTINLNVARGFLRLCKITPTCALSGQQAINILEEFTFDLIFMDHMMPGMDGIEATKIIRKMGVKTPIIALTANAVVGMREIFIDAGMNDALIKPVDKERFFTTLAKWLPPEKVSYAPPPQTQAADDGKTAGGALDEQTALFRMKVGSIKGLDTDTGLNYASRNWEYYEDSLRLMITEAGKCLENMGELLDSAQMKEFEIMAHSVKGSLASIGAAHLAQLAETLEKAAKAHDTVYCTDKLGWFLMELENFNDELKGAFAVKNLGKKQFVPPPELPPLFESLEEAFEEPNFEMITDIFTKIEELQIPAEMFDRLKSAVKMMDYQGAKMFMRELLGTVNK